MYTLLENISVYFDTTGSLRFYSREKATDVDAKIKNNDNCKSFKYKAKLIGRTVANGILVNITIAA